jgi:S-adenosylmethionine hydrolase
MKNAFIALMTDFGEDDFFVASLKGTILKINPAAQIMDITHRTHSFDPRIAGFILFACYKYFPEGTVFLVVVDPGVGSSRKILLAGTESYFFIAPDNGLLTMTLEEQKAQVLRSVENERYFLPERSMTFEARDKMAPVAAHLSKGVAVEEFGPELKQYTKLEVRKSELRENEISGQVLYTDKFGNIITNIPERMVQKFREGRQDKALSLKVMEVEIPRFNKSYSSVRRGELLFLVGSLGLVEVAAREDSASQRLKAKPGDPVRIVFRQ